MDEAFPGDSVPDLKDLELKVGRKTPEGLLRWLQEEPVLLAAETAGNSGKGKEGDPLGEKIQALKLEMACLRAIDVRILHQLVAVNEGIEAVKWLLEEKGNLASRCSSLTSSQYSLVESQDTSRRGSWNSLQDPNDKLDSISIGSYLDTLADEMDEYCQATVEPVMSTPSRPEGPLVRVDQDWVKVEQDRLSVVGKGPAFKRAEQEKAKLDQEWARTDHCWVKTSPNPDPVKTELNRVTKEQHLQQAPTPNGLPSRHGPGLEAKLPPMEKQSKGSPKLKAHKNGKVDFENCKLKSKVHLEYDTHWHWVQSQDDVTFL
ncbi:leucine rich adaptor protein 1 [Latimeria chalumnae]|uniref:leucine rich adaptor protein 1 n=1 Tax=Latimeria chalumnae TaxID=7897 RepID=UPI0003C164BC|nr:PREDICTED: leucine rich adaptor protein 1 [Latimeria chalumnae]|eukprot:XP_006011334.1 PREDICTED: leucine rich adaptor protein 1 [Latimeria chalumnae]